MSSASGQHVVPAAQQLVVSPVQPVGPPASAAQPGQVPPVNWSNIKSEFAGNPDEEIKAHLLRANDWVDTHEFPEGIKVQKSDLNLVGDTSLWYE